MTCTFFGHRDTSTPIKDDLKKTIIDLVNLHGVNTFYVGNNGSFDFLVQQVLAELYQNDTCVNFSIVLSSLSEHISPDLCRYSIFPEEMEKSLPRFAISKRNEWMIKRASFAIVYLTHKYSNCPKWVEKAEKRGIKIINLANANHDHTH